MIFFVYLSVCISIYPTFYLSIYLSLYLTNHLYIPNLSFQVFVELKSIDLCNYGFNDVPIIA